MHSANVLGAAPAVLSGFSGNFFRLGSGHLYLLGHLANLLCFLFVCLLFCFLKDVFVVIACASEYLIGQGRHALSHHITSGDAGGQLVGIGSLLQFGLRD